MYLYLNLLSLPNVLSFITMSQREQMGIIYLLLPISLFLGGGALAVFLWAMRSGQFDDLETPAHRILFDQEDESTQATENEVSTG